MAAQPADAWGTEAAEQPQQAATGWGDADAANETAQAAPTGVWGVTNAVTGSKAAEDDSESVVSEPGLTCPKILTYQLHGMIGALQKRVPLSQLSDDNQIEQKEDYSPLQLQGIVLDLIKATEEGECDLEEARDLANIGKWGEGNWTDYADSEFSGRENFSQANDDEEQKIDSQDVEMNESFSAHSSGNVSPRGFDNTLFIDAAKVPQLEVLKQFPHS